jgi:Raf kinase inhibitor-like YbhB/YbcL family protein
VTALAAIGAAFLLTSPAFSAGHAIPARYTCDAADVSPPLRWTAPPRGTQSLTVRIIDLDTRPPFLHWYVSDIGAPVRRLLPGARVGHAHRNDFGNVGYGGPCPPRAQTHRYLFRLVALGRNGRVLGRASLVGTYRRA